ncbi:MAG: tyrosine-protein phosphatase [Clostridia bacterium]|nr:tyrosine-protein phosphatase [Clostridia bacterium]
MKKTSGLLAILLALLLVVITSCAGHNTDNPKVETITEARHTTTENDSVFETDSSCLNGSEDSSVESDIAEESESEEDCELMITSPIGVQYPYVTEAKNYLEAIKANVKDYFKFMNNPYAPIVVSWEYPSGMATAFSVEIATSPDFSGACVLNVAASNRSCEFYNLFKSTEYFVKVTAYWGEDIMDVAESSFSTTSLGPRVMKVDGIYNVRDLGGYSTNNGETTLQGLIYRGGSLTPADIYDSNLTEAGKTYMSEEMKIKTEIDLRSPTEAGNLDESSIPSASLIYIPIGSYGDAFSDSSVGKQAFRKLFSTLANENNYPIYYHCTGGADKTGTVSFLLNALLGVDEQILINDYEFTSFSIYHMRNTKEGDYAPRFKEFRDKLEAFEGNTLQKKTENYLLSIGVTEDEIYNIRAIMTGRATRLTVFAPSTFTLNIDESFDIAISGNAQPSKLTVNDTEVEFNKTTNGISVDADKLAHLTNGTHKGIVHFENGEAVEFVFTYDVYNVFGIDDYLDFDESGCVVIDSSNPHITGSQVFGYGKTICINMKSEMADDSHGGIYVLIGSYGFLLRGGEFRIAQMSADGVIGEYARGTGFSFPQTAFNSGELVLYLTVEFIEDVPTLTVKVGTGDNLQSFTYVYQTPVANAIPESDARISFAINTSAVTSLIVFSKE